jgi:hypothetical protein
VQVVFSKLLIDMNKFAKPILRLAFSDLESGSDRCKNWLFGLLEQRFNVEESSDPDFLICSNYGHGYLDYLCPRIFISCENVRVSPWKCDFIFSSDYSRLPYHHRLPYYRLRYTAEELATSRNWRQILEADRKFACVVISNPMGEERNAFWRCLEQCGPVASGGHFRNNVGGPVPDKLEFCRGYKFCIAFENSSAPGYTTEKLIDAWMAGCVPIYWGDERLGDDLNTKCFIHARDFDSWEALADHVMELDQTPGLYEAYLKQPLLNKGGLPNELTDGALLDAFEIAFKAGHRIPKFIKEAQRLSKVVLKARSSVRAALRPKWYQ